MTHIRRVLATTVLALVLVGKAAAEQPPHLLPTRDVEIIYEVTLSSQPRIRERVRFLAAELLERVDGPHKSTTIFDRRSHEITILSLENRTFLKLNMPRQPQEPEPEATLKRGNESVVAGLHCVEWSWTEDLETRTVCLTEDGVLLRFLIDSKTVSEARSVSYRRQSVELFQVPPGYAPLLAPRGAPSLDRTQPDYRLASGRLLLPSQCVWPALFSHGRILDVAHESEAKAKKQSRTGFGICRVVIDAC